MTQLRNIVIKLNKESLGVIREMNLYPYMLIGRINHNTNKGGLGTWREVAAHNRWDKYIIILE